MKAIRENRDFEGNVNESSNSITFREDINSSDIEGSNYSSKLKKLPNGRSANRSVGPGRYHQDNNRQYFQPIMDPKSIYGSISREQHSMIDYNDESRDEHTGLPSTNQFILQVSNIIIEINRPVKKRDNTPARLEQTGLSYMERGLPNQYMRLAYLDADRKVVRVVNDSQYTYLQSICKCYGLCLPLIERFLVKDCYNDNDEQSLIYDDPSQSKDMIGGNYERSHIVSKERVAQGSQTDFADESKDSLPRLNRNRSGKQDSGRLSSTGRRKGNEYRAIKVNVLVR